MRRVLSELMAKEIKDPRVQGVISITEVKVDEDLKHAKIYVSIYGLNKKEKEKALLGLESSSPFLRYKLSENIRLKNIPELIFLLDDSIERGFNLIEKLDQIKNRELLHNDTEDTI